MKNKKAEGFTVIETLVGLAMVSILMLILAMSIAPATKTVQTLLLQHTQKDNSILLAKTLKTDFLFLLRGKEQSQFAANKNGFSCLTMHRPDAESLHSTCIQVNYQTTKDGLFRIQDKTQETPLLNKPVHFYYLAENGEWKSQWTDAEKKLPRAIKCTWPGPEENRRELIIALP